MAVFRQLWLLLRKNFTLRRRKPIILALELFWPILVFAIVVGMRFLIPPTPKNECFYKARAQPSAGIMPFLQSYVCNMDNSCDNRSSYEEIPSYPNAYIQKITPYMHPLMKNKDVDILFKNLPSVAKLSRVLMNAAQQPEVHRILGKKFMVEDIFKDPKKIEAILAKDFGFSQHVTDAILKAEVNLPTIFLEFTLDIRWKDTVCDYQRLAKILRFPKGDDDASAVSSELCNLNTKLLATWLPKLAEEIDFHKITNMIHVVAAAVGSDDLGSAASKLLAMAEVLVKRRDLLALGDKIRLLEEVATLAAPFVKLLDTLRKAVVDFKFLDTLLQDIGMFLKDDLFYNYTKPLLLFGEKIMVLMNRTASYAADELRSFGSYLKNISSVEHYLRMEVGLSAAEANSVLNAQVSPPSKHYLDKAASPGELHYILCTDPGMKTILMSDEEASVNFATSITQFHNMFCRTRRSESQPEEMDTFQPLYQEGKNGPSSKELLWNMMDNSEELLKSAQYLGSKFMFPVLKKGSLPHLDILWKFTIAVIPSIFRVNWTDWRNITAEKLLPLLDTIPATLPAAVQQTLGHTLFTAHIFFILADDVTRVISDSDDILYEAVKAYTQTVKEIVQLGPDSVLSLIRVLTNSSKLQVLLDDADRVDGHLCDRKTLNTILEGETEINATGAYDILCKKASSQFLKELMRRLRTWDTATKIESVIAKSVNLSSGHYNDTSTTTLSELTKRVGSFVNHMADFIRRRRTSGRSNLETLFQQMLPEADRSLANRWQQAQGLMELNKIPVLLSLYTKLLHKQIINSPVEKYVDQMIVGLNITFSPVFDSVASVSRNLNSNFSVYWPYAIETFLRTLQDKVKLQRLLRVTDWANVTCNQKEFWDTLVIPLSVNARELQNFLCTVTTSFQSNIREDQKWASHMQEAMSAHEVKPGEAWDTLSNHIQVLYIASQHLVTESKDRNYDINGLVILARDSFRQLSYAEAVHLELNIFLELLDTFDTLFFKHPTPSWRNTKFLMIILNNFINVVNSKIQNAIAFNRVSVSDVMYDLPTLTAVARDAISLIPDTMEVASDTVATGFGNVLSNLIVHKGQPIPCDEIRYGMVRRGVSISEIVQFSDEASIKLKRIESTLCTKWKQLKDEILTHPLVAPVIVASKLQDNQDFRWKMLGLNIIDLTKSVKALKNFQGEIFDDAYYLRANRPNLSDVVKKIKTQFQFNGSNDILKFAARLIKAYSGFFELIVEPHPRMDKYYRKIIASSSVMLQIAENLLYRLSDENVTLVEILGTEIDQKIARNVADFPEFVGSVITRMFDPSFLKEVQLLIGNKSISWGDLCYEYETILSVSRLPSNTAKDLTQWFCHLFGEGLPANNSSSFSYMATMLDLIWMWQPKDNPADVYKNKTLANIVDQIMEVVELIPNVTHVKSIALRGTVFDASQWTNLPTLFRDSLLKTANQSKTDQLNSLQSLIYQWTEKNRSFREGLSIVRRFVNMLSKELEKAVSLGARRSVADLFAEIKETQKFVWWLESYGNGLVASYLHTITEDPAKIRKLFKSPDPFQEWCKSSASEFLSWPSNFTVDLQIAKTKVCNLNWDSIQNELQGFDSQIADETPIGEFIDEVGTIFRLIQNCTKSRCVRSKFFGKRSWVALFRTYTKNSIEYYRAMGPNFWIIKALPLLDEILERSDAYPWLTAVNHILSWFSSKLRILSGPDRSLEAITIAYPEMNKLVRVFSNHLVTAAESWLEMVFTAPNQVINIIRVESWAKLCESNLSNVLQVIPDVDIGAISDFKDGICAINMTMLVDDLNAFLDWRSLEAAGMLLSGRAQAMPGLSLNSTLTEFNTAVMNLNSLVIGIVNDTGYSTSDNWMKSKSWENVISILKDNILQPHKLASSSVSVLVSLAANSGYGPIMEAAQEWVSWSNRRLETILSSGTNVSVDNVFNGFPELQKIIPPLIHKLPEATKHLLLRFLLDQEQMSIIMTANEPLGILCNSSVLRLWIKNDTEIFLDIFAPICASNLSQIKEEMKNFLSVDLHEKIVLLLNGNQTFNVNATELLAGVELLLKQLKTVLRSGVLQREVLPLLQSETWNNMMAEVSNIMKDNPKYNNSTPEEGMMKDLLIRFQKISQASPALRKVIEGTQELVSWAAARLDILSGNDTSAAYPELYGTMNLLNTDLLQLVEEIGSSLVSEPKILDLLMGDPQTSLCLANSSEFSHFQSKKTLMTFVCDINKKKLSEELTNILDVKMLKAAFGHLVGNSTAQEGGKENSTTITYLMGNATDLLSRLRYLLDNGLNLPRTVIWLNISAWGGVWEQIRATVDNSIQPNRQFWVGWVDVIVSRMSGHPWSAELGKVVARYKAVLSWVSEHLERISSSNSIKWQNLFENQPELKALMTFINTNIVDFAEITIKTAIEKPWQFSRLLRESKGAVPEICSTKHISEYLSIPSNMTETDISTWLSILCNINMSALKEDANSFIGLNALLSLTKINAIDHLSGDAIYDLVDHSSEIMATLKNLTITKPNISLNTVWANTSAWKAMSNRLREDLRVGNSSLIPISSVPFSTAIQSYLEEPQTRYKRQQQLLTLQTFMKLGINIGDFMSVFVVSNNSLRTMHKDHSEVLKLLDLFDHLPDLLAIAMTSVTRPLKLYRMANAMNNPPYPKFCGIPMNSYLTIPRSVEFDVNSLQDFICSTNISRLIQQLDPTSMETMVKDGLFKENDFVNDIDELFETIHNVIYIHTEVLHEENMKYNSSWNVDIVKETLINIKRQFTVSQFPWLKLILGLIGPRLELEPHGRTFANKLIHQIKAFNVRLQKLMNGNLDASMQLIEAMCVKITTAIKFPGEYENETVNNNPVAWDSLVAEYEELDHNLRIIRWSFGGSCQNVPIGEEALILIAETVLWDHLNATSSPLDPSFRDLTASVMRFFKEIQTDHTPGIWFAHLIRNYTAMSSILENDLWVNKEMTFQFVISLYIKNSKLIEYLLSDANRSELCGKKWSAFSDFHIDEFVDEGIVADVFCKLESASLDKFKASLDLDVIRKFVNSSSNYKPSEHHEFDVGGLRGTGFASFTSLMDVLFVILPKLEKFPYWQLVGSILQPINMKLESVLSQWKSRMTDSDLGFYDLLSNTTLMNAMLDILDDTDLGTTDSDTSSVVEYFTTNPNETKYFCADSLKKELGLSILEAEMDHSGNATAVFEILCKKPPSTWIHLLVVDARVPAQKLKSTLHNAILIVLPPDSSWVQDEKSHRIPHVDWVLLKKNVNQSLQYLGKVPSGFFTRPKWSYWKPVLITASEVLPRIIRTGGTKACANSGMALSNHTINLAAEIMNVISNQIQGFPGLHSIVCEIPHLNISAFYDQLMQYAGVMNTIQGIRNITRNEIGESHTCSELVEQSATITEQLAYYVNYLESWVHQVRLQRCVARLGQGTLFMEIDRYLNLLSDSLDLMVKADDISRHFTIFSESSSTDENNGTSLLSASKELLNILIPEIPVYQKLKNIVRANADEILEEAEIDKSVQNILLNSDIDVGRIVGVNFTVYGLTDMLCSPDQKFLIAPSWSDMNSDSLAKSLCRSKKTMVAKALISALDIDELQIQLPTLQTNSLLEWNSVSSLGLNAQEILQKLEILLKIPDRFGFKNPANITKKIIVEGLIHLMKNSTLTQLVNSLSVLMDDLGPIISDGSLRQDLATIKEGLKAISPLTEAAFSHKYKFEDLYTNYEDVKNYLILIGGVDEATASSIGTATVVPNVLLTSPNNFTTLAELLCDEEEIYAIMTTSETPTLTKEELNNAFCGKDESYVTNLVGLMVDGFNFNAVFKQFFYSGMLRGLQMKSNVSNDLGKALPPLIKAVKSVAPLLQSVLAKLEASGVMDGLLGQASAFINMTGDLQNSDLSAVVPELLKITGNVMCGKPIRQYLDDFKIFPLTQKEEITPKDLNEINTMPTPFCKTLLRHLMSIHAGPVLWGYLKPLLRGRLVYSPDTHATRRIIAQVNSTMNELHEFATTIEEWSGFSADTKGFDKDDIQQLQDLLQLPLVKGVAEQLFGKDILGNYTFDVSGLDLTRLNVLMDLTKVVANALQCVEMNRFIGVSTEQELELQATKLFEENIFMAGIVFEDIGKQLQKRDVGNHLATEVLPKHVKYKIRMDIDNVAMTSYVKQKFWKPGPEDNFAGDMRYFRGFIQLQDLVDRAIIKVQAGDNASIPDIPPTYTQQFPYPCYLQDEFGHFLKNTLPLIVTLAWIFLIAFFVRERVLERELHLEQMMKMMGLRGWVNWLAWWLSCAVVMLIVVSCITIILKLGRIFPHSDWSLLYLFLLDFAFSIIMFCYLMSVLFSSATLAALTSVIMYLTSYLPFVLVISLEAQLLFFQKILVNLIMSTSFSYGCLYISRFEDQGTGIQWHNIRESPLPGDEMNFSWACIMIGIDGLIYYVIALLISKLKGRKFKISVAYKALKKSGLSASPALSNNSRMRLAFNEEEQECDDQVVNRLSSISKALDEKKPGALGISLHALRKVYNGEKVAVDGLTVDFYENQITTLLGQNGAGKTTTIRMLTGMTPATSGSAFIYGKEVGKDFDAIRQNLGVCSQQNVLFPLFTVREHLEFYSRLKGVLSNHKIQEDVDLMLDSMNLSNRQDELVCNLSDGMQRRLCVAVAFVGGSRTIILDEPTSGVDPVARRHIWDLIVKHKHGRTILLTTHHLDEADILSDRVAIIHQGKLLCCGSPLYLKGQFGAGYRVTFSKRRCESDTESDSGAGSSTSNSSNNLTYCDPEIVHSFLRKHVANANLAEDHGSELVFSLPYYSDNGLRNTFDHLFTALDAHQGELGIGNYGLSCTTLEEVFLTVCSEADAGGPLNQRLSDGWAGGLERKKPFSERRADRIMEFKESPMNVDLWRTRKYQQFGSDEYLSGSTLKLQHLRALLSKRYRHTLRDLQGLFVGIVLPCLFIAAAMAFTLLRPVGLPLNRPLVLTPTIYGAETRSFVSIKETTARNSWNIMESLLSPGNSTSSCLPYLGNTASSCWRSSSSDNSSKLDIRDQRILDQRITWAKKKCKCTHDSQVCSDTPAHPSKPLSYWDLDSEGIVYNLIGYNITEWLLTTENDFRENRYGGWNFGARSHDELDDVVIWYNNKGYHSMPAYLNSLSNAILRTGTNGDMQYKITTINHPIVLSGEQLSRESILQYIADVGIVLVLVAAFSFIPASFIVPIVIERVREEKRLQFVCGVGPLLYWGTTFLWNMLISTLAVGLAAAVIASFSLPPYVDRLNLPAILILMFLYCWATAPLMYLLEKFFNEASLANMVLFCMNIFIGINTMVCILILTLFQINPMITEALHVLRYVFLIFPQYALGGALIELLKNHIQAEIFERFGKDTYVNPFSFEVAGLHMVVLATQGLLFFLLNLFTEYRCYRCRTNGASKLNSKVNTCEDDDVRLERKRIYSDDDSSDVLKLKDLTKVYSGVSGKKTAVDMLCLGIPKGECFGLLGVNGAGKTTTFRLLTDQLQPTYGTVRIEGKSVPSVLSSGSRILGFCPQSNALDDLLTAEELLNIYAKLRGVPSHNITSVVTQALMKFNLEHYARRLTKTFSTGTKRRLCAALSVLGDPELVLMDEPTSGMDPASRRLVWNLILQIIKDQRSVVLTSHSMEECDNLCTRLAIMVNGRFQCLGSPQYLKQKFGEGYTVILRVQDDVMDWGPILAFIHTHFSSASLKAQHCNTMEFLVPSDHIGLAGIFSSLEREQHSLGIEDFSVTQTTLDQVFVNFVRKQSDGLQEVPNDVTKNKCASVIRTEAAKKHSKPGQRPILYGHQSVIIEPDKNASLVPDDRFEETIQFKPCSADSVVVHDIDYDTTKF